MRLEIKSFLFAFSLLLVLVWSCVEEVSIPVAVDFVAAPTNAAYSTIPVSFSIANHTTGAQTYAWTFEGGTPATSTAKNPPEIIYGQAGTYKITLRASNSDGQVDTKTQTVVIDASISANFMASVLDNNYPPASVKLTNSSVGGETYAWTFTGGIPATSTDKEPSVVFDQSGTHTISLTVTNGRVSRQKDTVITVAPDLVPDFALLPDDASLEAPLTVVTSNSTISGTSFSWTSGGALSSSTARETTVVFSKPGTYTVSLTASNGKKTKSIEKSITVKPATGIYNSTDVLLGINTASSTIGSFYATSLRKTIKGTDVITPTLGAAIDIVFFGLDPTFTLNKFVSPTNVQNYTFEAIPGAKSTVWMPTQTLLSVGAFDAIKDDTFFKGLSSASIIGDSLYFSGNQIPRILLFRTADGRKGALKIKQLIQKGAQDSAILVDIKVQRTP